ncbi:MAG: hypothetical protein LUG65_08250 [Clostridiales bacterium]|nr:hypothetical protein [Clostridiales bacterium]
MNDRQEQTNPEYELLKELGFSDNERDTAKEALERFRAANKHLWGPQETDPEYLAQLKELGYDEKLDIIEEERGGGPEG